MEINECAKAVHATAIAKGWWDLPDLAPRNFGELLMLVVTEAAEAYEHYRRGQDIHEVFYGVGERTRTGEPEPGDKPDGVPIELADIVIRVFDLAEAHGMDIERAIKIKMAYNETRPHRHGGKLA